MTLGDTMLGSVAAAKTSSTASSPSGKGAERSKRTKRAGRKKHRSGGRVCTGKGKKRRCRWQTYFQGHSFSKSKLRTEPLPKPSGKISIYAVNFHEEVDVQIYGEDGELDEAALAELDHGFRCRRTKDERAVDPRLYEVLSIIYDHFGQHRVELISGFRFQRNEDSRHYHASAMDIRIPGVSIKKLYAFAESLDTGGMGIGLYPRAGFVHVDFRAPGAPSYRWTDRSPPGRGDGGPGKRPSRKWKRKPKPTS